MDDDRPPESEREPLPESSRSRRDRPIAPIPEPPWWRRLLESKVAIVVANLFSLLLALDFLVTHVLPLYLLLVGWSAVAAHAVVVGGPPAPSLRASFVTRARRSPFRVPTRRDLAVVVVGLAATFATLWGVTLAASAVGAPVSGHVAMENLGLSAYTLPVYVGAMLLVVGPVEEFLFRHLLQRRFLRGGPGRRVAIAAVAFGGVHTLVYGFGPGAIVPVVALSVIGAVFGVAYELTGNLTVPALVHGCYNASLFVGLFLAG
jgi:membrane protease YdiL (CAAX protease family)